jgi:hypothetical protein
MFLGGRPAQRQAAETHTIRVLRGRAARPVSAVFRPHPSKERTLNTMSAMFEAAKPSH